LVYFESSDLGDGSNKVNLLNQSEVLENHHHVNFDSIIVCDDGLPSAPFDILVSKEYFILEDLDLSQI